MFTFRTHLLSLSVPLIPILLVFSLFIPCTGWSADTGAEFNVEGGEVKKDNLFNLFFGGAPLMPTQHGTVIVEAYHDQNDNQTRDPGEETLDQKIICIVEEIAYSVPAFIPGLENGMNYTFLFEGEGYKPSIKEKNIFIKKRGQIIRLDIPCLPEGREAVQASFEN